MLLVNLRQHENLKEKLDMSKFIATAAGQLVSASEIVKVKKHGAKKSLIKTQDGNSYVVNSTKGVLLSKLEFDVDHSLPATLGYSVVFAFPPAEDNEDQKWEIVRIPVIGWSRRQSNGETTDFLGSVPIIPGDDEYSIYSGILLPDGNVLSMHSRVPISLEHWVDLVKEYDDFDNFLVEAAK
jgi:hypothetical protein